jgi:hypothetical protein
MKNVRNNLTDLKLEKLANIALNSEGLQEVAVALAGIRHIQSNTWVDSWVNKVCMEVYMQAKRDLDKESYKLFLENVRDLSMEEWKSTLGTDQINIMRDGGGLECGEHLQEGIFHNKLEGEMGSSDNAPELINRLYADSPDNINFMMDEKPKRRDSHDHDWNHTVFMAYVAALRLCWKNNRSGWTVFYNGPKAARGGFFPKTGKMGRMQRAYVDGHLKGYQYRTLTRILEVYWPKKEEKEWVPQTVVQAEADLWFKELQEQELQEEFLGEQADIDFVQNEVDMQVMQEVYEE